MRVTKSYQRGAKLLVHREVAIGGLNKQADSLVMVKAGITGPSLETNDGDFSAVDDEKRPGVTSQDWKWSCWRCVQEGSKKKFKKFYPDSDEVDPSVPVDLS
ncbi:uncharacterized protein [Physcomitrium patens]|uniref:uncharacterized protein isoform X2 n=1 Tax=Physcomitrium patens TaxID=3218 RepID=UPI003CCD59CE